jgi:hypothetical protein
VRARAVGAVSPLLGLYGVATAGQYRILLLVLAG